MTPKITFEPRYTLTSLVNPDVAELRDLILEPFKPGREYGEATITFESGGRSVATILIADRSLGLYLQYGAPDDTWLSLGDRRRLTDVVCPDDWKVSAGLFVSCAKAWPVIEEFCRTGSRSDHIDWIRPADVPEGGNW
jgi:hypothetical protein